MEPNQEVPCRDRHWLDKVIEEQAAYYGLTVDQHKRLMDDAATYQEYVESGIVQEDGEEWESLA